jgi:putative PIN family toxin of toxin-antitoxin system
MLPKSIVLDTNVIVSYLLNLKVSDLVALKLDFGIEIYSCPELVNELRQTLNYPRIKQSLATDVEEFIALYNSLASNIEIDLRYDRLADSTDNFLIDLAYTAKADLIVSGDRKVLIQKHFGKIQIVSPTQFRQILKKESNL